MNYCSNGKANLSEVFWKFECWRRVRFLSSQNDFATVLCLPTNHLPSKIPTMPFTAADLDAFWTDPAQMGIAPRTRAQMALEGLVIPTDFEDFSEKEDLEALIKLLLKPPKVPHGMHGVLREVASYLVSAKSQIRIDGARMLVLYYNSKS